METQSVLLTPCGATRVTRTELQTIAAPAPTTAWKPVKHADLVETIEQGLQERSITVCREQFAVQREGRRFFAVLDLSERTHEFRDALGLRASNDKTLAIQIAVGLRVFVCDNLALSGDLIALRRKHTSRLALYHEVGQALTRFATHFQLFTQEVTTRHHVSLSDERAKALIHDVFRQQLLPLRLFPIVSREYFTPRLPDFMPRTAWSLSNAFTHAAKALPAGPQFRALLGLGRLLSNLTN